MFMAQKPEIYRIPYQTVQYISSNQEILGFSAEIQIIFGTVT